MAAVTEPAEMGPAGFSLDARQRGSTLLLSLSGEFDWAATRSVEGALDDASGKPLDQVVFDLSDLTFIDITALKVILKTQERAAASGFQMTVVRPRGLANRIFTLTRAAETLEMVDHI